MKTKLYYFVLILLFSFGFVQKSQAAVLSLSTYKEDFQIGESFSVDLKLNIDKACVNTVETTIEFSKNIIILDDVLTGESLLSIWVDRPTTKDIDKINSNGIIHLSGGIPGGYCGSIPGDPGDSNLIARLYFRIPSFFIGDLSEETYVKIDQSKSNVYINDGFGTKDEVKINNLQLNVNESPNPQDNFADKIIKTDVVKPEPFVVELYQKADVYEGKYFIVFSTSDKQTGVDHYEVLEYKPEVDDGSLTSKLRKFFEKKSESNWKIASTPYLLEDQSLRSIIKVKAVDKAGNERMVEYIPPKSREPLPNYDFIIITVFSIIIFSLLSAVILLVIRRVAKKKAFVEEEEQEDNKEVHQIRLKDDDSD